MCSFNISQSKSWHVIIIQYTHAAADIDVTSWFRYLHISIISSIPVLGTLLFYTCDIGSSVGQYFEIDTGLQVEYLPKNTCLADISISKTTLFVSLCEFLLLLSFNIGWYCTKISLPVIPVITVFLADTCNLKTQDINITNIY